MLHKKKSFNNLLAFDHYRCVKVRLFNGCQVKVEIDQDIAYAGCF